MAADLFTTLSSPSQVLAVLPAIPSSIRFPLFQQLLTPDRLASFAMSDLVTLCTLLLKELSSLTARDELFVRAVIESIFPILQQKQGLQAQAETASSLSSDAHFALVFSEAEARCSKAPASLSASSASLLSSSSSASASAAPLGSASSPPSEFSGPIVRFLPEPQNPLLHRLRVVFSNIQHPLLLLLIRPLPSQHCARVTITVPSASTYPLTVLSNLSPSYLLTWPPEVVWILFPLFAPFQPPFLISFVFCLPFTSSSSSNFFDVDSAW